MRKSHKKPSPALTSLTKSPSKLKRPLLKNINGKTVFQIGGIGTAIDDIDEAIREIRQAKIAAGIEGWERELRKR